MRDPSKKKLRDLRRIARSSRGYNPSIFKLFKKYHPELNEFENATWHSSEWHVYLNMKYDWISKVAGYRKHINEGSPPSWYRRMHNRMKRARRSNAFRQTLLNDNWDNYSIEPDRHTIRRFWW